MKPLKTHKISLKNYL